MQLSNGCFHHITRQSADNNGFQKNGFLRLEDAKVYLSNASFTIHHVKRLWWSQMDFFFNNSWESLDQKWWLSDRRWEKRASQTDNRAAESFSARLLCVGKMLEDPKLQLVVWQKHTVRIWAFHVYVTQKTTSHFIKCSYTLWWHFCITCSRPDFGIRRWSGCWWSCWKRGSTNK